VDTFVSAAALTGAGVPTSFDLQALPVVFLAQGTYQRIRLTGGNIDYLAAGTFDVTSFRIEQASTPVPEPATMTMLGLGIFGMALRRFRRKS
jgi:hypothetical protein